MDTGNIVTVREKVSYGMGNFGVNIAYAAINLYFVFFLTDVAGLPVAWAGYIFLIARVWDAVTDYFMGILSDRTKSRFGRRRPYILFGSIPLGLVFALIWIVPFRDQASLFCYYTGIMLLFNTLYTIVAIPYNSLLPDLSQDYDERTGIAAFSNVGGFAGTLFAAAAAMLIVDLLYPGKSHYQASFPVMGAVFGLAVIGLMLITFFGTRERAKPLSEKQEGFVKTLFSILKIREFRLVLGLFISVMAGIDIFMVMVIYLLKYVAKIPEDLTYILMAIPLVAAAAATPLWVKLSQKWGKQKTFIISALSMSMVFLLILIVPEGDITSVIILSAVIGMGVSALMLLPYSMIPDIVEVDELKSGTRREGSFYGLIIFGYKAASALAVNIAAVMLGFSGYIESAGDTGFVAQPQSVITGIRLITGIGPGIFLVIAALFAGTLNLDKKRFDRIKMGIEAKRNSLTT